MHCRVLIIGGGSIGERHVRCFQRTKRAEVLLCETNDEVRLGVERRYKLRKSFRDLSTAIDTQPHAAVICTPAHLHVPMAIQLAEAGIHLLIEKPLSIGLQGINRLLETVGRQQLTASVAYVNRTHPILCEMKAAIDEGRFGDPVQIVVVAGQNFAYCRPAYKDIYYADRATGGGAIQDALTHHVNAVEWLVGPVTRLVADADHQVLEGVDVEDTVHVITRHASVQGCFSLNQHQAPNECTITAICRRGTVRFELHRHRWSFVEQPTDDWTVQSQSPLERDDLFVGQANIFLDTVEGLRSPSCSLEEGVQSLRVSLAIQRSIETRTWRNVESPEEAWPEN